MKQAFVIFRAVLAIMVLASLAACKGGTFNDPGHEAAGPGFTDGGSGGGSGGGGGGKPERLSNYASYEEAIDTLDEIIKYCDAHPGQPNDTIKLSAQQTKDAISLMSSNWIAVRSTHIGTINSYISSLK
jgi:hypothetical protein